LAYIAALGDAAAPVGFELLQSLRQDRALADRGWLFEGGFFEKKLGAQLTIANRLGATDAVIVGDDEIKRNEVTIKSLASGAQETLAKDRLTAHLMDRYAQGHMD